jgi:hypothetical protein
MNGKVKSILNPSKKTGTSTRDGKTFNWNIMTVEVIKDDGSIVTADSFDPLDIDMVVQLESQQNGEYLNWKAKRPRTSGGSVDLTPVMEALKTYGNQLMDMERKIDKLLGNDEDLTEDEPIPEPPEDYLDD